MQFFKMQSMGNDFVVFGSPSSAKCPNADKIAQLCDRRYGVGADCAIFIAKSKCNDYSMHVYNPDGFEAEICGNALKCSAKYVTERGYFKRKQLFAETLSGTRELYIEGNCVNAQIGTPRIIENGCLDLYGMSLPYTLVDMGNPHCVVFLSQLTNELFLLLGPFIEKHKNFPNGTNVEFASIIDEHNIKMRVWERGIGETLSCITGSCACVAAASYFGICENEVSVHQRGGIADIKIEKNGCLTTKGEVHTVFTGKII